jgi:Uma2 family endonuclease
MGAGGGRPAAVFRTPFTGTKWSRSSRRNTCGIVATSGRVILEVVSSIALPGAYRMTYADWLKLPDDGRLYELIEGELLVTPPPSVSHQRISRDLEFALVSYLRRTGRGEVLDAPVGVKLSDEDIVEPDLVIVLAEHSSRIGAQVIDGPPDIVVEILSPGTAKRDLGTKRAKYASTAVPEYWIVDPEARAIEVLCLGSSGYERFGLFGRGDALRSRMLPDFELLLSEVFRG